MSESIESFSPSEQNEGVDAAALERLREQMRAARAQMQKDQAQEKKHKKKEDSLFEVLFLLIKKLNPQDPRVQLVVNCLSKNLDAQAILVILSLEFSTVAKLLEITYLEQNTNLAELQEKSLIVKKLGKKDLSIFIRYNLDLWLKTLNKVIFARSEKNLRALHDTDYGTQGLQALQDILNFIAKDYLSRKEADFTEENLRHFIYLFTVNLQERLEKQVEQDKLSQPTSEASNPEQN